MTKVTVQNGPEISFDDTGRGGVPLIFSHGLFMKAAMFSPQVAAFAAQRRCITWDQRAHGGTHWREDFTYWDSAHDLLGLMDALGIDKAIHCGMSQGGLLGMRAAILAPHRFYGIIQLATQAGRLEEEEVEPFRAKMNEWIERGASEDTLGFLTDVILGPGFDASNWRDYWQNLSPAQIRTALSALYSLDELYDRLHEVTVPLATIHGLADVSTPYERAVRVAQEVPDPRGVTLVEGGPHAVNLTHPGEVNEAISVFLDGLARDHPEISRRTN